MMPTCMTCGWNAVVLVNPHTIDVFFVLVLMFEFRMVACTFAHSCRYIRRRICMCKGWMVDKRPTVR
jgi:hypothetical protein